jgi:hypothetical protein
MMQSNMRIVSVRIRPVAQLFAWIYGCLGVVQGFVFALGNAEKVAFPLGIVAPLVHFNVNWIIARPANPGVAVLVVLLMVVSYAITGSITGALLVLCFNLASHIRGGVDATLVHLKRESPAIEPQATGV